MLAALLATIAIVPVTIHEGQCPGTTWDVGCYRAETNEIWVTDLDDRLVLAHERGHAFDTQRMVSGERRAFSCLPGTETPHGGEKTRCGETWTIWNNEVLAEAYANCLLGLKPGDRDFLDGHDYGPTTQRRHRNVCRFIARAND